MIRPAVSADVEAVLELWLRSDAEPTVTDTPEDVGRLVAEQPGAVIVAEESGELVGTVIATWDGWRGGIYRLAVRPDHRRRGLGRALVAAAGRRLREVGAKRVGINVVLGDEQAMAFWRSVPDLGVRPDPSPKARFIWRP